MQNSIIAVKHIPMEIEETLNGLDYKEIERVADALKVMAHPVRIAILALLEDGSSKTVTEIFQALSYNFV